MVRGTARQSAGWQAFHRVPQISSKQPVSALSPMCACHSLRFVTLPSWKVRASFCRLHFSKQLRDKGYCTGLNNCQYYGPIFLIKLYRVSESDTSTKYVGNSLDLTQEKGPKPKQKTCVLAVEPTAREPESFPAFRGAARIYRRIKNNDPCCLYSQFRHHICVQTYSYTCTYYLIYIYIWI